MVMRKERIFISAVIGALLIALSVWGVFLLIHQSIHFNGQRAYQDVLAQVAFGPRVPDSLAHAETITYIQNELRKTGWQAQIQDTTWQGFAIRNIIASRTDQTPQIILGAHYDSRMLADQDPGPGRFAPVPGANDGASGVAVCLNWPAPCQRIACQPGWYFLMPKMTVESQAATGLMGSQAFVASLTFSPKGCHYCGHGR